MTQNFPNPFLHNFYFLCSFNPFKSTFKIPTLIERDIYVLFSSKTTTKMKIYSTNFFPHHLKICCEQNFRKLFVLFLSSRTPKSWKSVFSEKKEEENCIIEIYVDFYKLKHITRLSSGFICVAECAYHLRNVSLFFFFKFPLGRIRYTTGRWKILCNINFYWHQFFFSVQSHICGYADRKKKYTTRISSSKTRRRWK